MLETYLCDELESFKKNNIVYLLVETFIMIRCDINYFQMIKKKLSQAELIKNIVYCRNDIYTIYFSNNIDMKIKKYLRNKRINNL
jgi:hypothetical protein